MNPTSKDFLEEQKWWDKYGGVYEKLWNFSPYLFNVVRKPYLEKLEEFIFQPGGRLLDFGCGGGRVSISLAMKGMHVRGIDDSSKQIEEARKNASRLNVHNVEYSCGSLELLEREKPFDGIILHSVLHHLADAQKVAVLGKINDLLSRGGRLYLYEPIAHDPGRPLSHAIFDKSLIAFFRLLGVTALFLHWYTPDMEALERQRWRMKSPDEAPIPFCRVLELIPPDLRLARFSYEQAYSNKFSHFCMSLKPRPQKYLERTAPFFYWLDRRVLATRLRDSIKVWPMASFFFEKVH